MLHFMIENLFLKKGERHRKEKFTFYLLSVCVGLPIFVLKFNEDIVNRKFNCSQLAFLRVH